MKKLFSIFLLSVAAGLFSSCEDVVQIKLDQGSRLYVLDAFLTDGPFNTVKITSNDSYFSDGPAPFVSGAQVAVKDLTSGTTYNFSYSGNGNYVYSTDPDNCIGIIDHRYELQVTIDNTTYTSQSVLKRTAGIDSIEVQSFDQAGGFGPPPKVPYFFCNLWAKDKTDANTDYYWIKTIRNDTLLFGPSDINISIDGTNGPVNIPGLDSTAFTPPITFLGFTRFYKGATCEVQIHSISKETYAFFVQAQAQINNGGLFATTPENVRTNIITPSDASTKAIGWFNMAAVAKAKVAIP
jgi:hypothetical protein